MRFTAILFLALISGIVNAQDPDLDHLMTRKFLQCPDITLNCKTLIPLYEANGRIDSVTIVLDYWTAKCGPNNDITNTEVLLQIAQHSFEEGSFKDGLLEVLLDYKSQVEDHAHPEYHYSADHRRWQEITDSYNTFIKYFAAQTKATTTENTIEHLIAEFYSQNFDPLLFALKNNTLHDTRLQQDFNSVKARVDNLVETNMAVIAEYWMPTHQAKILGNHPGVGGQIGMKRKRLFADLTFLVRFVDAKEQYSVFDGDSMYTTNHFGSAYAAFEVGHVLWEKKNSEFSVLGGIANDMITVVPSDEEEDIPSVSINTLNLNLGAGYRYYLLERRKYLGIQLRYNIVDYFTKGGTDLSGNTISLRLLFGSSANPFRDSYLSRLGY